MCETGETVRGLCWRKVENSLQTIFIYFGAYTYTYEEIIRVIQNIFGDEIHCSCSTIYLDNIAPRLPVRDKCLLKILLAASKKAVTRKWLQVTPPRETDSIDTVTNIQNMERMTFSLCLRMDKYYNTGKNGLCLQPQEMFTEPLLYELTCISISIMSVWMCWWPTVCSMFFMYAVCCLCSFYKNKVLEKKNLDIIVWLSQGFCRITHTHTHTHHIHCGGINCLQWYGSDRPHQLLTTFPLFASSSKMHFICSQFHLRKYILELEDVNSCCHS